MPDNDLKRIEFRSPGAVKLTSLTSSSDEIPVIYVRASAITSITMDHPDRRKGTIEIGGGRRIQVESPHEELDALAAQIFAAP